AQRVHEGERPQDEALRLALEQPLGLERCQNSLRDEVLGKGGRLGAGVLRQKLTDDLIQLAPVDQVAAAQVPDEPFTGSEVSRQHVGGILIENGSGAREARAASSPHGEQPFAGDRQGTRSDRTAGSFCLSSKGWDTKRRLSTNSPWGRLPACLGKKAGWKPAPQLLLRGQRLALRFRRKPGEDHADEVQEDDDCARPGVLALQIDAEVDKQDTDRGQRPAKVVAEPLAGGADA